VISMGDEKPVAKEVNPMVCDDAKPERPMSVSIKKFFIALD